LYGYFVNLHMFADDFLSDEDLLKLRPEVVLTVRGLYRLKNFRVKHCVPF
jgi:hypothetical protein